MLTPSLRSSLLHRPSMLAKRRAMPMTSRYRTLISPPSCADECPASGHRVSGFRESNRTARRHGGFRKPLDQLWKRLVALYKKLVYGVARVGRWDA